MKKLPRRFQYPLMVSMVLPTMLMGMPAIQAYKTLPQGEPFLDAWLAALGQMLPTTLLLLAVVAPTARLVVTRLLLEPEVAHNDAPVAR
ncbi:DUF2798 domain-containing protein [Ferrimonas balearica]|uniref:DUF2798 domain-containing protein n=1 Tax=Ferrimonas balearica TaxID=44012 RepID=UPI001C9A157E|nr:DUF2798 domain-containing protein [Ferrimonas balearica]MBY5991160.1 DUF2798 domain-containing protein [Ferrimonas balearica]